MSPPNDTIIGLGPPHRGLQKIVSGGQTGVDRAALDAAIAFNTASVTSEAVPLQHGGWCPPGRVAEDGVIPTYYYLQETTRDQSLLAPNVPRSQRTEWNVRDSDATLILHLFCSSRDPGTEATRTFCQKHYGRPILEVALIDHTRAGGTAGNVDAILSWLAEHDVRTLNVAGPSETSEPGIYNAAFQLLTKLVQTQIGTSNNRTSQDATLQSSKRNDIVRRAAGKAP
jgi:Circularly permutated YpsA SLOG family